MTADSTDSVKPSGVKVVLMPPSQEPWTVTDELVQRLRAFLALPVCERAIQAGPSWSSDWLERGSPSLRVGHVLALADVLARYDAEHEDVPR